MQYRYDKSILTELFYKTEDLKCCYGHIRNQFKKTKKKESCLDVRGYLDWCKNRQHVNVIIRKIPNDIITFKGAICYLADIKIQSQRGQSDDEIFSNNSDIRKKICRGNCILVSCPESQVVNYELVIQGLKKFTGGSVDNDDSSFSFEELNEGVLLSKGFCKESSWTDFFLKPLSEAITVECLRKANGEAAHLSARWSEEDNQFHLFLGSKNVHILIKDNEDIDKYTELRYEFAKKVAHTVLDTLNAIGPYKANCLLTFLAFTRFTAVMELLQPKHMHVENLDYLPKNELCFIAWTSSVIKDSYCALKPSVGIKIANMFGLKIVNCTIIKPEEVEDRCALIRNGYQYEGEVLYYIDQNDNVIGLSKKKTKWYIILRALREKVKNFYLRKYNSLNVYQHIEKMDYRLKEIQQWLTIENSEFQMWKKLIYEFINYCWVEKNNGKLTEDQFNLEFPLIWKLFLTRRQLSDKFLQTLD